VGSNLFLTAYDLCPTLIYLAVEAIHKGRVPGEVKRREAELKAMQDRFAERLQSVFAWGSDYRDRLPIQALNTEDK